MPPTPNNAQLTCTHNNVSRNFNEIHCDYHVDHYGRCHYQAGKRVIYCARCFTRSVCACAADAARPLEHVLTQRHRLVRYPLDGRTTGVHSTCRVHAQRNYRQNVPCIASEQLVLLSSSTGCIQFAMVTALISMWINGGLFCRCLFMSTDKTMHDLSAAVPLSTQFKPEVEVEWTTGVGRQASNVSCRIVFRVR